jgi:hypothetical protein
MHTSKSIAVILETCVSVSVQWLHYPTPRNSANARREDRISPLQRQRPWTASLIFQESG